MPTGIYPRTKYHKNCISEACKQAGVGKWMKGRKLSKITKSRISLALGERIISVETRIKLFNLNKGKNNYHWKGGKTIHRGYVIVTLPSNEIGKRIRVPEHRLIMKDYLKRELNSQEVVHHINGIKNDNRIENLMLFANAGEHKKFHREIESQKTGGR